MAKKGSKKSRPNPGFDFGIFDFDEFADWLAERYGRCAGWLMATAKAVREEMDDRVLAQAYKGIPLAVPIDTAYLSMLALAIRYSLNEDLFDGRIGGKTFMEEPSRRARFMLELHADRLPVRIDQGGDILAERAALAGILTFVALDGFNMPIPIIQEAQEMLPAAVRSAWKKHKYSETPLCQLVTLSFWIGFRSMVSGKKQDQQWRRILADFWEGWGNHLLDVSYAIREEDLQANEKME